MLIECLIELRENSPVVVRDCTVLFVVAGGFTAMRLERNKDELLPAQACRTA